MHVSEVRGIGPKKADLLKSMGIVTLGDMLAHYPYAYEDRSRVTPIAEASEGAACYIRAVVLKISKNFKSITIRHACWKWLKSHVSSL